ncbi:MAG: GntR family transcriptional regulator [Desulfovibrionales bacterium]
MTRNLLSRPKPLGEEASQLLRRMIINGDILPGERLVEEKLAARLGISRTPLREALHRLEQAGILEKLVRGGYVVRPLTVQEVEEAVDVRAVLEGHAARRAAARADESILGRFRENMARFEEANARREGREMVRLNSEFHALLHEAADSGLLSRLLADLGDVVERITRAMASSLVAGSWSMDEHRQLLKALEAGDPELAERLAREHVLRGGAWTLERMKEENLEL